MDLIQPVDFSALFQLAFTLYAAFIAIEYTKSFTAKVIKQFYNFQGEIESKIKEILESCRDEEMTGINSDEYFNTGQGLILVDEYKQKHKQCKSEADNIKASLNKYVMEKTEYRIFRYFSLFIMLFCFTVMVAGGIYRIYPSQTIHFLLSFIACGTLFVLVGWICTAIPTSSSWLEKRGIITPCLLYVFLIILSFLSLWAHLSWDDSLKTCLWTVGIISSVMLPYLNFLFFFFLVTIQMRKIRNYCKKRYTPLIQRCKETGELMVKVLNFQEMKHKIDGGDSNEGGDKKLGNLIDNNKDSDPADVRQGSCGGFAIMSGRKSCNPVQLSIRICNP